MSNRKFPEQLAEKLVERFATNTPVDLQVIAQELGVGDVQPAIMLEDGSTRWSPSGKAFIKIRSDRPACRQRFTLAHELSHVLLAERFARDLLRRNEIPLLASDDEEVLCDLMAASLLMPRHWMQKGVANGLNLLTLDRLAHEANVSLSAVVVRCRELFGTPIALVGLRESEIGWIVNTSTGISRSRASETLPGPHLEAFLTQLPVGSRRTTNFRFADDVGSRVVAESVRRQSMALVLLIGNSFRP
jgi:Zn-dependent peptidase ImmA (M78 family)